MDFRRFKLIRTDDVSGVSGTGVVAIGVKFPNGQMVMTWITKAPSSIGIYQSEEELLAIHGHGGRTSIVWIDEEWPKITER